MKDILFDAFGTLFNTHGAIGSLEHLIPGQVEYVLQTYRQKLLEMTWVVSHSGQYLPFDQLSRAAVRFSLARHEIVNERAFRILTQIYADPDPFPEVPESLGKMKEKEYRLYILSNGTGQMLRQAVENCGWQDLFDGVFSVHRVRRYKPDPVVYHTACSTFRVSQEDALFVSSNDWDIYGATKAGLNSAWLNRDKFPFFPYPECMPGQIITDLGELTG